MPKQKTKQAAAKRFAVTAGGKLTYKKAGAGHLLGGKTRKRKRKLRKTGVLSATETKRIERLLNA